MIIQFALFVFAIGGFLSFNVHYNFSYQFLQESKTNLFLPYYFISCFCIILMFSPTLLLLMRHNSVSLRILNNIDIDEFNLQKEEQVRNIFESKNYTISNPFYQEQNRLNIDVSEDSIEESFELE